MASASESLSVTYGSRTFTLDKAPAEFPQASKEILQNYQDYAIANKMIAVGDPGLNVLFVTSGSANEANKLLKSVHKLITSFEKSFGARKSTKPIPIFLLKKTNQYSPLIDQLVKLNPYLSSWAGSARALSGFELYKPPIIVILQDGVKQEEYSLENQVVHQLTHLLIGLEFETQPFWFSESIAWSFEDSVCNSLYSFCYRDSFIFQTEHKGWDDEARKLFVKNQNLSLEEICSAKKDQFDKKLAVNSYALLRYLVAEKPAVLKEILLEFTQESKGKDLEGKRQAAILQNKLGKDLEKDLYNYWTRR